MDNNFLDKKYSDLHKSKSVERAVKQTHEKIYQKDQKIEVYLDRLEKLILDPKKEQKRQDMFLGESRPRALSILREMVMNKYVRASAEKKTEGAVMTEENAARDLGMNLEYGEEQVNQRQEILVKDLEKSLDAWISYLSDNNEPYPTWFRYYVFRNVLNLGDFDKDKGEFRERSQGSAYLFPDIDRGALAYIQDVIEATKDEKILSKLQEAQKVAANNNLKEGELITREKAENFSKMTFAKQYAEAIKLNGEITPEMREEIRGKWIKYQQGTDPTALWASLQNKGTAWCTKGFATASTQLKGGDFYVYYTLDKTGEPKIPRIAIRMNGQNQIGEIRGVADNQQNMEGNMTPILDEKLKDFGNEGDKYKKKSQDMKKMTNLYNRCFEVDKKTKEKKYLNPELLKEDLIFLYEMDLPIEGFGYQKDHRIIELKNQRNLKEDVPIVFECEPNEIAWSESEVNPNTKVYIGPLFKGIFQKNFEHLYSSFPEGKIQKIKLEASYEYPKNKNEWIKAFDKENIYQEDGTAEMLEKMENVKLKKDQDFVILTVKDLFNSTDIQIYENICKKAEEFGLELCKQDDGPKLRLNYNQPMGTYFRTAMEPIKVSSDLLRLWNVHRNDDGKRYLLWNDGDSLDEWSGHREFVFRLSK